MIVFLLGLDAHPISKTIQVFIFKISRHRKVKITREDLFFYLFVDIFIG